MPMNGPGRRRGVCLVVTLLAAALGASPALAEPRQLFLGSEGASTQAYAYVGILAPWADSGARWATRYWIDAQRYEYDSNGRTVVGKAVGFSPAVVRSFPFADGYVALSAGLRFADTRLTPDDPGNKQRGFKTSVPLQIDGQLRAGRTTVSGIASAEPDVGSYWTRARVIGDGLLGPLALGVEVIAKGSDEYSARQAGLVVGAERVTVKLGASRQDGRSTGAYLGVEVGMPLGH